MWWLRRGERPRAHDISKSRSLAQPLGGAEVKLVNKMAHTQPCQHSNTRLPLYNSLLLLLLLWWRRWWWWWWWLGTGAERLEGT